MYGSKLFEMHEILVLLDSRVHLHMHTCANCYFNKIQVINDRNNKIDRDLDAY